MLQCTCTTTEHVLLLYMCVCKSITITIDMCEYNLVVLVTCSVMQVYATRQPVDLERSYPRAKRVILRDVPRTDRNIHYFRSVAHTMFLLKMCMIDAM